MDFAIVKVWNAALGYGIFILDRVVFALLLDDVGRGTQLFHLLQELLIETDLAHSALRLQQVVKDGTWLADASIISFSLRTGFAQVSAGTHLAVPGSKGAPTDIHSSSELVCMVLLKLVCQNLLEVISRPADGPCEHEGPIEANLHLLATLLTVLAEPSRRPNVFLEECSTLLIDIIRLGPA